MLAPEEQSREPFKKVRKAKLDQIKEVVSAYLQRRNYPSIEANKTSPLSADEFTVSCLIDNDISRPNSILYSCLNNDPTMIDQTFTKFVSWIKELIKTKSEYEDLEKLIGPVFCHFYFEILRGGHSERANHFFKLHVSLIERDKCDTIVTDLINTCDKENSATDVCSLKDNFRSNKYTVQLSTDSVNVLKKFLEEGYIVLLHVLQNWFIIEEMMEQDEEEAMDVNGCDNNSRRNTFIYRRRTTQKLLSIINTLKTKPKPIYCVNIKNVRDEITCGALIRDRGLMAYSYNNCVAMRPLEALQQFQGTLILGEAVFLGHSGRIYDIAAFSNYLISASQDKTIRLYDTSDRSEKMVYFGHDYPIYCLCASRNNEFFVSGSYDRTARLWSISRKDCVRLFIGHTQDITSVDFHPNSNYVVSGSTDKNIKMWAISNAEPVRSFPGSTGTIYAVRFSPDGKYLFSTGEDAKLRIWDLQAGKELINMKISEQCGIKIAIGSNEPHVAVGSVDGSIKTWNFEKLINELTVEEPIINRLRRSKLLALDYCYGTFGCLSVYEKRRRAI